MRQLKKKEVKKLFKESSRDKEIYVIAQNIQYARNVASLFRIADAAQVRRLYLTGISQKPPFGKDLRKASRNKEQSVEWVYQEDTISVIKALKNQGFIVLGIELTDESFPHSELSQKLKKFDKVCFVAGSEVYGVTKEVLQYCDNSVHIPMYGRGSSLNVSVSVGIVLFSF